MELKAAYKIFPRLNLIVEYYQGSLTVQNLIKFKKELYQDKDFDSTFNYIDDCRDVNFVLMKDDIAEYINFEKKSLPAYEQFQSVFLTNTPLQAMVITLYLLRNSKNTLKNNIVYTIEYAFDKLKLPMESKQMIESTLLELPKSVISYN